MFSKVPTTQIKKYILLFLVINNTRADDIYLMFFFFLYNRNFAGLLISGRARKKCFSELCLERPENLRLFFFLSFLQDKISLFVYSLRQMAYKIAHEQLFGIIPYHFIYLIFLLLLSLNI